LLKGKVLATLFFEPSTRIAFPLKPPCSVWGGVISMASAESSSAAKGDGSGHGPDRLPVRRCHRDTPPRIGSAKEAADAADVPVINAGTGQAAPDPGPA